MLDIPQHRFFVTEVYQFQKFSKTPFKLLSSYVE